MARRPYLVTPERECIPLEGAYRIEEVRGEWYVLGEHRVVPCRDRAEARITLSRLRAGDDVHERVAEALEGLSDDFDVVASSR
jgi:hypothetical protein